MFIGCSGCLIPLLLILNLFFGKLFFSAEQWLAIEGLLFLVLLLTSYINLRRFSFTKQSKKRSNVIDVEGKVVK
jgi:hypothetical protein